MSSEYDENSFLKMLEEIGLKEEEKRVEAQYILDEYCRKREIKSIVVGNIDGFAIVSCGRDKDTFYSLDLIASAVSVIFSTGNKTISQYFNDSLNYMLLQGNENIIMIKSLDNERILAITFDKSASLRVIYGITVDLLKKLRNIFKKI